MPAGVVVPDGTDPGPPPSWLGSSLAVRSAFGIEDGDQRSMAGRFDTELRVAHDAVPGAVTRVRRSGDHTFRRDVLVMEMVDAEVSGVAFSEPGYEDDLIEWTEGTAEELVAGQVEGHSLDLARLRPDERAASDTRQGRLAQLLREVRAEFGDSGWDIEWADDGSTCWLLQVRPITAPVRRNDWFTMAKHREILPDPPSPFMTSVIAEGSPRLFDYYRRFDPSLSDERLFIEVFDHRPMINLSLMTDFMRSLGLPSRLVTDSIGGGTDGSHGIKPLWMARKLPVLARLGWAQVGAARFARRQLTAMRSRTASPAETMSEAVDRAVMAYVAETPGAIAYVSADADTGDLRVVRVAE